MEEINHRLFARYAELAEKELKYEAYMCDDAEVVLVAYGTVARISKSAVHTLREMGIKAGLFRPVTLYPFPEKQIAALAAKESVKRFVTIELSMGQMIEDVRLAVNGAKPVAFFGRTGGNVMTPDDIVAVIKEGK